MTTRFARLAPLAAILMLAPACSVIRPHSKNVTPTVGNRVAILVNDRDIMVDPATAALPMSLPAAEANADWPVSGGNPTHDPEHVALGASIKPGFAVPIGLGDTKTARLGGGPVVGGGRVYTIDNTAEVRAFDAATGALRWKSRFGVDKRDTDALYGGGVAYEDGRVYAVNGLGYVAALDAATGKLVWRKKPSGPLRGAPTAADGAVYAMGQDNTLFALNAADGSTLWTAPAAVEIAGVFGAAAPAVGRGTVVAGFSSGELNGYRYENGRQVWGDVLARTSINTSVSSLSDIDADPVISDGVVYALGEGGRLIALDILTGQRLWEANMAGTATPWVAGDWLFAVSDRGRVVAMNKMTGKIRWISQLPAYTNAKKKTGAIRYVGPVLAGGRLVLASNAGTMSFLDPVTGKRLGGAKVGGAVRFQPVVAGGRLFLLTGEGRLISYR